MGDAPLALEKEYCPPIDPSLFHALLSDYDVSNQASLGELREVLDSLKRSAIAEEASNFDPSGTTHLGDDLASRNSSEKAGSLPIDVRSSSAATQDTELTGIASTLEGLDLNVQPSHIGSESEHYAGWNALSLEAKEALLKEMFPTAKLVDVSYVLKKSNYNHDRAIEELLSRVFLEQDTNELGGGFHKRGIDGFSEPTVASRRKKRGKKARLQRRTSSTPAPLEDRKFETDYSPLSRWDRAKEDIEFVSDRTHLAHAMITSTYHKHGASLSATIAAICLYERHENPYVEDATSEMLITQAAEIASDFPNLNPEQSHALVRLTYPSTASAHELARALMAAPYAGSHKPIIPQYQPRRLSDEMTSKSISLARNGIPSQSSDRLSATRHQAFNQAAAAYRTSKSKPLMGGAAAYYSSVARDASIALRQREAAEAEALVVAQSRIGEIDLHGVQVRDGVDIAKRKVEQWWDSAGREWAREGKARGGGMRLITGKGHHSQGGKARLGPAVGAMLVREGWKMEIGEGVIDVVGKIRR